MSETEDFLDAVDDHLPLVGPNRIEVIDELFDHIEASALELEAGGMPPYDAEREAVRRMGDPETLASDLGKARESRRALVPAVGTAMGGLVRVGFGGLAVGVVVFAAAGALAAAALTLLDARAFAGLSVPYVAVGMVLPPFVAYLAGRDTPYRIARRADRSLEWGRRATLIAGLPVLVAYLLLTDRLASDAWTVASVLVTPLLLVAGTRTSSDPPGAILRRRDLLALFIATALLLMGSWVLRPTWVTLSGLGAFPETSDWLASPVVPGMAAIQRSEGPWWSVHVETVGNDAVFHVSYDDSPSANYSSPALEVWRGSADGLTLDPSATAPLFTVPMSAGFLARGAAESSREEVRLDTHLLREWPATWYLLTADAPDGSRVVVHYGNTGDQLQYRGSLLDWLLGR